MLNTLGTSLKRIGLTAEIRDNLASLTHDEDPQLKALKLRAEIAETSANSLPLTS